MSGPRGDLDFPIQCVVGQVHAIQSGGIAVGVPGIRRWGDERAILSEIGGLAQPFRQNSTPWGAPSWSLRFLLGQGGAF